MRKRKIEVPQPKWEATKPVEHYNGFKYQVFKAGTDCRVNCWTRAKTVFEAKKKIEKVLEGLNRRSKVYKYGKNTNVIKLYSV